MSRSTPGRWGMYIGDTPGRETRRQRNLRQHARLSELRVSEVWLKHKELMHEISLFLKCSPLVVVKRNPWNSTL